MQHCGSIKVTKAQPTLAVIQTIADVWIVFNLGSNGCISGVAIKAHDGGDGADGRMKLLTPLCFPTGGIKFKKSAEAQFIVCKQIIM